MQTLQVNVESLLRLAVFVGADDCTLDFVGVALLEGGLNGGSEWSCSGGVVLAGL
jgi:hypothetical protein